MSSREYIKEVLAQMGFVEGNLNVVYKNVESAMIDVYNTAIDDAVETANKVSSIITVREIKSLKINE